MSIHYDTLKNWPVPVIEQTYRAADTIIYNLSVGYGQDPMDLAQLPFVYENGLSASPTMASVLAAPGFWLMDPGTGIDWKHVVHGQAGFVIHQTLPSAGRMIGTTVVDEIYDKGAGVGALLEVHRDIRNAADNALIATVYGSLFCRADGGFGGKRGITEPMRPVPTRAPDAIFEHRTLPQQALLYRLNGDFNPLHIDPRVAEKAGFKQPILHGLCMQGIVGHALLRLTCDYQSQRLRELFTRFISPTYPGEAVRVEVWSEPEGRLQFRALAVERNAVLVNGHARIDLS